jgi:5-methylcytosine-specific restriction endonuclease McrA
MSGRAGGRWTAPADGELNPLGGVLKTLRAEEAGFAKDDPAPKPKPRPRLKTSLGSLAQARGEVPKPRPRLKTSLGSLAQARGEAPKRRRRAREMWSSEKRRLKKKLLERDGPFCAADGCFEMFGSADDATIDHVKPRSKGGTNDLENLQLMCGGCNHEKGDEYDREQGGHGGGEAAARDGRGVQGRELPHGQGGVGAQVAVGAGRGPAAGGGVAGVGEGPGLREFSLHVQRLTYFRLSVLAGDERAAAAMARDVLAQRHAVVEEKWKLLEVKECATSKKT